MTDATTAKLVVDILRLKCAYHADDDACREYDCDARANLASLLIQNVDTLIGFARRALALDGHEGEVATVISDMESSLETLLMRREHVQAASINAGLNALLRATDKLTAAESELTKVRTVAQKILDKLDHPTASVTQWDADELRQALAHLTPETAQT